MPPGFTTFGSIAQKIAAKNAAKPPTPGNPDPINVYMPILSEVKNKSLCTAAPSDYVCPTNSVLVSRNDPSNLPECCPNNALKWSTGYQLVSLIPPPAGATWDTGKWVIPIASTRNNSGAGKR